MAPSQMSPDDGNEKDRSDGPLTPGPGPDDGDEDDDEERDVGPDDDDEEDDKNGRWTERYAVFAASAAGVLTAK